MIGLKRIHFPDFKCKTEEVEREVLNDGKLELLKNKTFPSVRLGQVRDIFLFSCYTGYAYTEARALTLNHVGIGLMEKNGFL